MDQSQIYQQLGNLGNYAQQQAQNYQGQYNANQGQFNQAQQNLQGYQQNMPNLSQQYGQNLGTAEQNLGFNPASMRQAQQALATTQTTMANLPQAIQQSANGRGLTGAQEANRLAQSAGNLNSVLAGQANNVNALQQTYQNAMNQANQQTGYQGQTEQMRLGALQNLVANTQAQEQQALQELNYYGGLRAQGIQLTEGEQTAAAQAAQAYAAAAAANQQTKMYAAQAALYGAQQRQLAQQQMGPVATPAPGVNYGNAIMGNIGQNYQNDIGQIANYFNKLNLNPYQLGSSAISTFAPELSGIGSILSSLGLLQK